MAATTLSWAYVRYDQGANALWHQRWVLGRVAWSASRYAIATPDGDVYLEHTRRTMT